MKKILSFLLIVAMMLSFCVLPVSAQSTYADADSLERICVEAYLLNEGISTDDEARFHVKCQVLGTVDGYVVFREYGMPILKESSQKIGNYIFTYHSIVGDERSNPVGLYVLGESGKVMTLKEAYDYRLISIDTVAHMVPDTFRSQGKYEQRVVELLYLHSSEEGYLYNELYFHYEDAKQTTPTYVLVFAAIPLATERESVARFGDNVIVSHISYYPYSLGYHIYVPSEDKVYTLAEAYEEGIENINMAFTASGLEGGSVGDVDRSGEINIRDATWIQKRLAGLIDTVVVSEYIDSAVQDFNKDGEFNIKDATAVQKFVAGITTE